MSDNQHQPTSRSGQALLYAVSRGYFVDDEGVVHGPHGPRKLKLRERGGVSYYTFTVGFPTPNEKNRKVTYPVDVHRLVGFQKFGHQIFDPNLEVRHLGEKDDPNSSLNNRPENIGIGTKEDNAGDRSPAKRKSIAKIAAAARQKLTPDDVRYVRAQVAKGEKLKVLAKRFDVSVGNISMIANRKIYKDVE